MGVRITMAMMGLGAFVGISGVSASHGGSREPDCKVPDTTELVAPTTISDLSDGVSSDGRGPYTKGAGGVIASGVHNEAALTFYYKDRPVTNPRSYSVNLNRPVRGGGGSPLGIITQRDGSGTGFLTQLPMVGDSFQNLHSIPVGRTVKAAQTNVSFTIDGRKYTLQMGPQPVGHCMGGTRVNGAGTSSATIHRSSQTKWSVDLPSRSVGRLFDIDKNDVEHAVDKGLYYVHLHYEIGK